VTAVALRRGRDDGAGELLSATFLERLRAVHRLLRERRRSGDARGVGAGPSPEFDTHRPYELGDDPRSIDWNVYARLERLLLKVSVREDERPVCLLLDTSESMRATARKTLLAARCAAAFAWLGLIAGRPLVAAVYAERLLGWRGPLRGEAGYPETVNFFSRPPRGRGTRIGAGLQGLAETIGGHQHVVVISDLLEDVNSVQELFRQRSRRLDLHVVQVLDDAELVPQLHGETLVRDCEGGQSLRLHAGADLLADLQRAIREHLERIERGCRDLGVPHVLLRTSQHFESALLAHLGGAPPG
jgi:uncharacterized protein (DUF58 family)